ncbi:MAG: chromosomal replication initiator protein DnaA [Eubacterium sp.]|jgi:chromosomal replication initiator protein|nr:chromosomal replication initiator protein DnaA [Eubacterium sp.]
MNSFSEIFEYIKSKLDLTDTAMKLWIDPIQPIKLNNNKVVLYVASSYGRQIVSQNYTHLFEREFQNVLGFPVEIEFLCENDLTPEQKIKIGTPIPELQDDDFMREKLERSIEGSYYQHTFETFIVGESNNLAYAACKAVAQGQNNNYNPLYIYSEPGLGKTHLLSAVRHEMLKKNLNLNIILVPAETFISEFINSLNFKNTDEFNKKYRSADVLLIDDVQFFSGKKESQNALFHIFNELHSKAKQIILTSDRPPKEINDIEHRLITRFEWGLLADITIPEFETRLAIIKRKAELLGLDIPHNVMEYIADKLKNNIRQLEGSIIKMNALCVVTDVAPTILMAQNVIKDVLSDQQPIPVTVEKIICEVSSIYNVTPEEIRSQNRSAQISTARQVAIYVVHKITGLSYTAIGQEFGKRDHSTIVYAINKVKSIIKKDNSYRGTIEDLIKNMGNLS